jgi:hypothetical protein
MAAGAQTEGGRTDIAYEVFAGSELEGYLRTLQNVGAVGPYPWSVRAFSPAEVERMTRARTLGPWAARFEMEAVRSGPAFGWTTPRLGGVFNSAFPYGGNDGPLWAGRGLTTELQFGGFARWGPLSVVIHPVWFRAENADFLVAENGLSGEGVYRSALTPGSIDLPQRFGAGPYGRLDPGYSTVRLDFAGVTAGFSTAAQQWGASHLHPLVLGPAGGGFVHVFLGTDGPRNVGIGRVHARYVAGRTRQSDYFGSQGVDHYGFVTGLVVLLEPRGLTGLEVGAARFFKLHWDSEETRVDQLVRPFETFLKRKIDGADQRRDQQFASVFARWSVPDAGIELFGEYVRVDHSYDLRVLMLEPDDQAGYALGLRRVWEEGDGALTVLRGEAVTSGSTHRERGGARVAEAYRARPIYHEGSAPRLGGHTHHGQLLATVAGEFGNGQTLGLDRYTQDGRWSVELDRRVVRDRSLGLVPEDAGDVDVLLALGGEVVRFRGRWELRAGAAGVLELNRHLRDDAVNLNFRLGAGMRVP